MSIIAVCFTALLTVTAVIILKNANSPFYIIVAIIGSVIILFSVLNNVSPLFNSLAQIADKYFVDNKYVLITLKCFGILLISSYTVELCKDGGNNNIGFVVSFGSKTAIVIIILPLIIDVLGGIIELIG